MKGLPSAHFYLWHIHEKRDTFGNLLRDFFGTDLPYDEFLRRIDEQNAQGLTLLTKYIRSRQGGGHISSLLAYGANVNQADRFGKRPLELAVEQSEQIFAHYNPYDPQIVEELCEAGAMVDDAMMLFLDIAVGPVFSYVKHIADTLIAHGARFSADMVTDKGRWWKERHLTLRKGVNRCVTACAIILRFRVVAKNKDASCVLAKILWRSRRWLLWGPAETRGTQSDVTTDNAQGHE